MSHHQFQSSILAEALSLSQFIKHEFKKMKILKILKILKKNSIKTINVFSSVIVDFARDMKNKEQCWS